MSAKRSSRRFQFENLEARQLMAADLYLDFGAAFNLDAAQGQHLFQVEKLNNSHVNVSGVIEGGFLIPSRLSSLTDGLVARHIDYDQNGTVNSLDADALAQDVADMVSRIYEPFALNVNIVASANMDQVIAKLSEHSTNDAYILAGGHIDGEVVGGARRDVGNVQDNVGFAFAEDLLDKALSLSATDGVHPWTYLASTFARTIAHEAAHTFGLQHLLSDTEGLTENQIKLAGNDLMNVQDNSKFRYMNLATRWNGLPTADGTQNAFEVLGANLGFRANGPAYVTGTGADDVITIQGLKIANQAMVTVSAFRDAAHTDLIETQSYFISTANGVTVEAGRRDDRVEIRGLSVPVTLRGGSGDDELIGSNGNDTLEGDSGIDKLLGAGGNDTYVFRGPRYQDLNRDDIDDTSGADDTLDFSRLAFAVNVDLASTANQQVEYQLMPVNSKITVNGNIIPITLFVLPIGEARLNLNLKAGTGSSTGIENVRGTRFDDHIYGNELDNELFGNAGNDLIYGYDGIDQLFGGLGDDILHGGDKRDYLYGESGRDQLFGELGDDYLDGGFDGLVDILNGGEGADEFVQFYLWVPSTSPVSPYIIQIYQLVEADEKADFNVGLGDKIVKRTVVPVLA